MNELQEKYERVQSERDEQAHQIISFQQAQEASRLEHDRLMEEAKRTSKDNYRALRTQVQTQYTRGKVANSTGFRKSSVVTSAIPRLVRRGRGQSARPGTSTHSSNSRDTGYTGRTSNDPGVFSRYAENTSMAPYQTWLIRNDERGNAGMFAFIVEAGNEDTMQLLELRQETDAQGRGRYVCHFQDHDLATIEAWIKDGTCESCTETDIVVRMNEDNYNEPVHTLEEMEEFKIACRQWLESDEARGRPCYCEEFKELQVFAENEALVHDIAEGDTVYFRERHNSQTSREPGVLQADGRVHLVNTGTTIDVQPKEVYHITSECIDSCVRHQPLPRPQPRGNSYSGSQRGSSSSGMSSPSGPTRSSQSRSKHSSQGDDGDATDQVTLQKMWSSMIHGHSQSSEWEKDTLCAVDHNDKQGKHFGLMKQIYQNLIQHQHNSSYVLYMINQMTACSHIAETTIDTFVKENNGMVIRPKDGMSTQEAVDGLFRGITGADMTSLGLQSHRVTWNLLKRKHAWGAGDATTKLTRELAVVEQNMAKGVIAEYADGIMYIDPILERSGLPLKFFAVTKELWKASFRQFNTKELFIGRVRADLCNLLEGPTNNSIFSMWHGYKARKAAGKVNPDNQEDKAWIEVGALSEEKETNSSSFGRNRGRTSSGQVNHVTLDTDGVCYAVRTLPSEQELQNIHYKSKDESLPHAKEMCAYHAGIIRKTQAFKENIRNRTKSEEEMLSNLHTTEECLAYQQPYLACTAHSGGPQAIIHIYETDDQDVSKRRWGQAADVIRQCVSDNSGDSINCIFYSDTLTCGHVMHITGSFLRVSDYMNKFHSTDARAGH